MSLGILGDRRPRVLRGLGGEPPPDPWCWKAAGYPWGAAFDSCHAANWKACDGKRYEAKLANKPWTQQQFDDCVYTADNTKCDCPAVKPGAPPSSGGAASTAPTLTMGNKTSDPRVVELQKAINATLTQHGYAPIGTDGKLGPGTCGAAREADKYGAGLMARYGLTGVCTSFNAPVPSGGGGGGGVRSGSFPPATLEPVQTQSSILGMNLTTALIVGGGAYLIYLFFGDKKAKT